MAEKCPGCGKNVRRLAAHLRQSHTCPEALKYQTEAEAAKPVPPIPPTDEDFTSPRQVDTAPASREAPPPPPGLTEAQVKALLDEGITAAVGQISEALNKRLAEEHQATQQQFAQVGPAVLKYLREEGAKEQAQTQPPPSGNGQPPPQGMDGFKELANIVGMFVRPAGGGIEQIAETIGSIGKLADAMDSLRYRPWRDGVDFATQNILQRTRMPGGPTPEDAAADLQKSMQGKNTFARPSLPGEGKP